MPTRRLALLFLLASSLAAQTGSPQPGTLAPKANVQQADPTVLPDADDLKLPAGPPTGPRHIATGIVRAPLCFYPTTLTFQLEETKTTVFFYTNNYFKIPFATSALKLNGPINPCKMLNGLKARITYGLVSDKRVAGQVYSVELTK